MKRIRRWLWWVVFVILGGQFNVRAVETIAPGWAKWAAGYEAGDIVDKAVFLYITP